MSKADKKQRHKAKREEKRRQARRRDSISPAKRLADAPGTVECWISEDFESMGQIQLFAYKKAAGISGVACFLVDRGVVGLKDAWVRTDMTQSEFDEMLATSTKRGIAMRRTGLEEVRRWVAGGLRWAYDNGMRLPKDWIRPALILGGVGDWKSAEVCAFVKEFAGHPLDLRQRLIAEPFESYIRRRDIRFIFDDAAPIMDQNTGQYANVGGLSDFDDDVHDDDRDDDPEFTADDLPEEEIDELMDRLAPAAAALVKKTTNRLAEDNELPSPELLEAWQSIMIASMLSKIAMPNAADEEVAQFGFQVLGNLVNRIEDARVAEYERALAQALEHAESDPTLMSNAVMEHGLRD